MNIPTWGGTFSTAFPDALCNINLFFLNPHVFRGQGIPPFHSTCAPFSKRRVPKIRVPKTQFCDGHARKLRKINLNIFLKFPKRSLNPNLLVEGHHRPSTLWKLIRHLHLPSCKLHSLGLSVLNKLQTTQDYNSQMIWKDYKISERWLVERCYCVLYILGTWQKKV